MSIKKKLLAEIESLKAQVVRLEDDVMAYATEVVTLAEEMAFLRKAFQESYNPYGKSSRAIPGIHPVKYYSPLKITVTR